MKNNGENEPIFWVSNTFIILFSTLRAIYTGKELLNQSKIDQSTIKFY